MPLADTYQPPVEWCRALVIRVSITCVIAATKYLRKATQGRIYFASWFDGAVHHGGMHDVRTMRWLATFQLCSGSSRWIVVLSLLPLCKLKTPAHGMMLSTFRVCYPFSVNLIHKISQTCQKFVFHVILDPVRSSKPPQFARDLKLYHQRCVCIF